VFPLLVLAAALFMARLWKERGRIGQLGAALAAGGALLWITTVCRPVLGLHEARSSTEMLHSLSTRIEGTDVVVVEGSRVGYLVAVPLQYLFGKHVLLYKLQRIGDAFVLDRAAKRWAGEGRKVFYLSPWQAGPSPVGEMGLQAIDRFTLTITRPRESWTSPPRGRESLTLPLYLHRFAAAGDPRPSSYAEVNLGEDDFGRVEGFYGPEFAPGSAEGYRWSGRRAKILFPPLSSSGPLRLTLRVSAPRGRGGSPLLRLFVSEEPVAELYPGPDWAVHEVEVPRADPLRAMLRMDSDSWNPLHEGFSDDDRYLGVRVDWARLEVSE
jgi:hypothetical protein